MIEINLLPLELRDKAKPAASSLPFNLPRIVPIAAAGVAGLMIVIYVVTSSRVSTLATKLHEVRLRLGKQESLERRAKESSAALPTLLRKAGALDDMVGQRVACWRVLEQVALACPPNVQVKRMKIERRPDVADGRRFVISGFYRGRFSLEQEFLNNLRGNAVLREIFANFLVADRSPERETTSFTIFCDFSEGR